MNEYLEREAVLDCACSACEVVPDGEKGNCPYRFTGCKTYYNLFIMPSSDARQVVRGKWMKPKGFKTRCQCSECKVYPVRGEPNFCPNCGADMRGEHSG
jgi:hypothetical protein